MRVRVIALQNQRLLEVESTADELTLKIPGECIMRLTRSEAWEVAESLDELATSADEAGEDQSDRQRQWSG
jgi:hypothetical protein